MNAILWLLLTVSVVLPSEGFAVNEIKSKKTYKKPSESELREKLSPMQFKVSQQNATEPAFQNEFWNNKEEGIYVDIATGEPLFSSGDKYDSGCGWPSFTKPIDAKAVLNKQDKTHGMDRIEIRSRTDSHLGHVFEDGPKESGGLRYCINSASLRFIAKKDLKKEGYEEFLPLFNKTQTQKP